MFRELRPIRRKRPYAASAALHGLVVLWLVAKPAPEFLAPAAVLKGQGGTAITRLYWPADASRTEQAKAFQHASRKKEQQTAKTRLTWRRPTPVPQGEDEVQLSKTDIRQTANSADRLARAATAGSLLGSLADGPSSPFEVRPALPVAETDPNVEPSEIPGGAGTIVVEVVIDETGRIVRKTVLQSLGPNVDAKVLAALDGWHFRPATRDGVPIPSKQDVHYHFPL
jgi:TonB family protein